MQLVGLLHKWNKAYNLTSVRDPDAMLVKHILDSLVVVLTCTVNASSMWGTGQGSARLPLAIINPDKQFVLGQPGKRINPSAKVILELGLTNVTPVKSRVEEYQPETGFDGVPKPDLPHGGHAELVSSSAVTRGQLLALRDNTPSRSWHSCLTAFVWLPPTSWWCRTLEGERHLLEFKAIQPE